jgi:hypothetical protein
MAGYAEVDELKSWFRIEDTVDDAEITAAINAISRQIDHVCSRHFFQLTEPRTFAACEPHKLKLGPPFNDLVSVTELATDDGSGSFATVWAPSDFQLLTSDGSANQNAAPEPQPWGQIRAVGSHRFPAPNPSGRRDLVRVTGVWGWPEVPADVKQALRILAAENVKLREAPFGVAGFGDFGVVRVRDNPKAMNLLAAYIPILWA